MFRRKYVFIILESNAKEDLKAKQTSKPWSPEKILYLGGNFKLFL